MFGNPGLNRHKSRHHHAAASSYDPNSIAEKNERRNMAGSSFKGSTHIREGCPSGTGERPRRRHCPRFGSGSARSAARKWLKACGHRRGVRPGLDVIPATASPEIVIGEYERGLIAVTARDRDGRRLQSS